MTSAPSFTIEYEADYTAVIVRGGPKGPQVHYFYWEGHRQQAEEFARTLTTRAPTKGSAR